MAKLMQLEILTPDRSLLMRDDVSYVLAETIGGGVGILANHAPLIGTLDHAPLKYKDAKEKLQFVFLDGGFIEVNNNKVTILSVAAEKAEEIDVTRATHKKEVCEERLANPDPTMNFESIKEELKRANGRLKTVGLAKEMSK